MRPERKICVGQIAGAHGVRGFVRLHSFTDDPDAIFDYAPLTDEEGEKTFDIEPKSIAKDHYVVAIEGVKDRDAAEELRGLRLYAARTALPKVAKREFYAADLVGLEAKDKSGKLLGTVLDVHNYGAGPFLEIGTTKKDSFMLPFTDACVPEVDVKGGQVILKVPAGWP